MENYYLVDFENVHNEGIANIEKMTKSDHIHVFSTQNATNIRADIFWLNRDIKSHLVPVRKQSLDMHLVSYLGYLLGIHGKDCNYVIVSKDKDYDNIVKYWKEEGYPNISRKENLAGNAPVQRKTTQAVSQQKNNTVQSKKNDDKREQQVRSFFGKHFKKKLYVERKEEIIKTILEADTKQQVNNGLMKLYSEGTVVSHIYKTMQPLIGDLPGK